jgi:hypothetical protein
MSDYADQMNYHNRKNGLESIDRLRSVNFADALGETSVRTRRALLALSLVAMVFARYTINVKQIPWLEIPAPVDATALIPMLLFAALAYHWVSLTLYGLADAIKWETTKDSNIFAVRSQLVYRLDEHIRRFEDAASKITSGTDLGRWIEAQKPLVTEAREVSECAIAEWKSFYRVSTFGFWRNRAIVWLWEIALPLGFGAIAAACLYQARL